MLPGPENPYPISDQNIRFSPPYFRPDYQNVHPISDPVKRGNSLAILNKIYSVWDLVTSDLETTAMWCKCPDWPGHLTKNPNETKILLPSQRHY